MERGEYELPAVATGQRMDPKGTNLHASPTSCETCQGDRFVVVAERPVKASAWMKEKGIEPRADKTIEEVAPCPDCNPQVVEHYRADGHLVQTPDPAKVRELLRR